MCVILCKRFRMRICPIISNSQVGRSNNAGTKNKSITFGTYNPVAAHKIEEELALKGITCNAKGNDFVAECFKKTVEVFEKLFGKSHLPSQLNYEPLNGAYGQYGYRLNDVVLNSNHNLDCFYDMSSLQKEASKNYNSILPSWNSTGHSAHVFVHEFSHAAHWHHLEQRNGYDNALKVWKGLAGTEVPTAIGRLITKFKLSKYAVKGNDMCEFLAERMTKDICGGLTNYLWVPNKEIDVDYSNIFSKKWNYRYSSPQSYIDYFTQQVWDGNIEEAKRTGYMVEAYLAELEAEKVSPMVQTIANKLECTTGTTKETTSIFAKIGSALSRAMTNWNTNITNKLDAKNKLELKL